MKRFGTEILLRGLSHVKGYFGAPIQRLVWLERSLVALAVTLAIAAVLMHGGNGARLHFQLSTSTPGSIQFFYSDADGFSEARSQMFAAGTTKSQHTSMPIQGGFEKGIRIDPQPGMADLQICGLMLQTGSDNLVITPAQFEKSANVRVTTEQQCTQLIVDSSAEDPQILVDTRDLLEDARLAADSNLRSVKLLISLAVLMLLPVVALRCWRKELQDPALATPWLYRRLPWMYLVAALALGGLYAVVTPPGGVPDEQAHLAKIVLVENGHWLGGHEIAVLDPPMSNLLGPFGDFLNPSKRFTVAQVIEHASSPLQCSPVEETFSRGAASYSPSMYAAGSLLLNAACRTDSSVGTFFYGSRLLNLVLAVMLTFAGIRAAGSLSWPIALLALMPMTLFEQASLSADSMTLGLSFLLLGLHAGLAAGQIKRNLSNEVWIFIASVALVFTKPGAAWLCAGFLFSWRAYQGDRAHYLRACAALVVLPWILHAAWIVATAKHGVPRSDVDVQLNLHMLLYESWKVVGLVYNTFFGGGSEVLWMSLVGRLGWLDVVMQPWAYTLAYLTLAASVFMRGEMTPSFPVSYRAIAITFAVGAALIPTLPMFLYWTPPGAGIIEGLQGRYFIPMAAFMLTWISIPVSSARLGIFCFSAISLLLMNASALCSLVSRYYG